MRSATWLIFRKEWLDVVRDRRAVFLAFVLPMVLYPVLFLSFSAVSQRKQETETLRVGLSGDWTPFLPYLDRKKVIAEEARFDPETVREGSLALFASFEEGSVILYHAATSPASSEARRRVEEALEGYRNDLIKARFARKGRDVDPARIISVEPSDVSTPAERSAALLGRLLPILLVILLLTGGSFAAMDLVAGEKERGTLETLYLHPVDRGDIVRAKFLVVLVLSFAALLFNFAGFLVAFELGSRLGLGLERIGGGPLLLPPVRVLALALVITAPLAVLTSAVLLAISSFARSFREAQTYLLPVTLVALVLVIPAALPHAELSSIVAIVPIANAALAAREALEGNLDLGPFAVAFVSSSLYAWAALRKASAWLGREDLVLGLEPPPLLEDATAEGRARRAVFSGAVFLVFFFFAAPWIQAKDLILGLAATLWGLVLVPACLYPAIVKVPFRATLGLCRPPARSILLSPLIALSSLAIVSAYMVLQDRFLPLPSGMEEAFRKLLESRDVPPWLGVLLFAISPGICEELLWRGAFQGELELRGRPIRTALTVALFFGLFHLNIYRLVPAAMVGFVLATLRQRSGSIYPCMLTHALYNATLYLAVPSLDPVRAESILANPLVAVGALLVLGLSVKTLGTGPKQSVRQM